MVETQPYRITRQVPLIRLERFCRRLETVLSEPYNSAEAARLWRLYVSAECSGCGLGISGEELHALALAPCAELASAKIGRMRLGDCARSGCNAWHYNVHFWNQEGIDWRGVLEMTDKPQAEESALNPAASQWLATLKHLRAYAPRVTAVLGLILLLLVARQLYLGGRIPLLREPEKFRVETAMPDPTWPIPMNASE